MYLISDCLCAIEKEVLLFFNRVCCVKSLTAETSVTVSSRRIVWPVVPTGMCSLVTTYLDSFARTHLPMAMVATRGGKCERYRMVGRREDEDDSLSTK